ncbi:hypothetical protein [Pelagerythrobacter marensis]|uniref:PRC-barrel domain-containing protein n=1 Tax=Pelagerythrobacter marensis TaxID=543877 RepID=A0A0G3X6Q9_9SPHN|nr:hypothetical protein [Pelagerythrobacter marensis]AKM07235.1 hypothetical protein AM2010_1161 [Pelagerythrobacter marensis]
MKFSKMAITAIAAAGLATAAHAQGVSVGATVYGPEGNSVGTIENVAEGVVTVNTGKHRAPLPANAFGEGEQGPTITVTKAQLDQMLDEQLAAANAQRDAALVATAAVITADNQQLGVVKSVEGDNVIVTGADTDLNLLREHFAVNQSGQLIVLFTQAQIQQALAAQTAAAQGGQGAAEGSR